MEPEGADAAEDTESKAAASAEQAEPQVAEPAAQAQADVPEPAEQAQADVPEPAEQAQADVPEPAEQAQPQVAEADLPEPPEDTEPEVAAPAANSEEHVVSVISSFPEADLPPPASVPIPAPATAPSFKPPAVIDDISPDEGSIFGDTRIVVSGDNLFRVSIVRVGGELCQPLGADEPRELRALTPPGKRAGAADVTIQNPGANVVTKAKAFRYLAHPAPKITSVAPNQVGTKGGSEMSIIGNNFARSTVVLFDGEPVSDVAFVDNNTLDLKTPPGTNGKVIDVTVKNPDGKTDKAPRAFEYDARFD